MSTSSVSAQNDSTQIQKYGNHIESGGKAPLLLVCGYLRQIESSRAKSSLSRARNALEQFSKIVLRQATCISARSHDTLETNLPDYAVKYVYDQLHLYKVEKFDVNQIKHVLCISVQSSDIKNMPDSIEKLSFSKATINDPNNSEKSYTAFYKLSLDVKVETIHIYIYPKHSE